MRPFMNTGGSESGWIEQWRTANIPLHLQANVRKRVAAALLSLSGLRRAGGRDGGEMS